jgi:ABC-type phosphate transport system substrate-binding protein
MLISSTQADVAVIANLKNNVESLTRDQVQDIFLGRTHIFPNEKFALPIDQTSPLRAEFYRLLTGRGIEQINAYWARLIFTAQISPPLRLPDDNAVMLTVKENEGAIGYIEKAHADNTVRVLLILP